MPELHENEIGKLPPLTGEEHLALLTGMAMVARGEDPTPNVATVCIRTLARLAGVTLPEDTPGHVVSVGNLPGVSPLDTTGGDASDNAGGMR